MSRTFDVHPTKSHTGLTDGCDVGDPSSNSRSPSRDVRRSFNGIVAPIAIALAGLALPLVFVYDGAYTAQAQAAEKPHWKENGDGSRTWVRPQPAGERQAAWSIAAAMGLLSLGGAVVEYAVRRQISLVRDGLETEAIIDEVIWHGGDNSHYTAKWSFIAADNKIYHGHLRINDTDAMVLQMGSRVRVFYDPAKPKRNRIDNTLWAVEWVG